MRDTLPFLYRLGLEDDTDSRSIRRAYAREVKLIDQAQDPAAFQELREAYDTAMQWAAWRDQQVAAAEPAPAEADAPAAGVPDYGVARTPVTLAVSPATPPAEPPLALDDPQAAATAVFEQFQAAAAQLMQQHRVQNTAEWQRLLQQNLEDGRLLNINARIYFEARIAQLLAAGWQPGHETLLVAAGKVFHWSEDRRRLHQLGQAGALIDRAIDEQSIYERLPESELMLYRSALALLRKDTQPTAYQLRGDMPYVARMLHHFPTWMAMVVDMRQVQQWQASYAALPPEKKSWWPKLNIDISPRMGWVIAVVLFQVLRMTWSHHSESVADYSAPSAHFMPSAPSRGMPDFTPLPEHIRQEIVARMPILPLQLGGGEHEAEFAITLDADGKIYQKMMYRTSGSVSYDEAVSKALYDFQPFPPETPRKFQATFTAPTGFSR